MLRYCCFWNGSGETWWKAMRAARAGSDARCGVCGLGVSGGAEAVGGG
jgi:hypothetical protein